ncbi:MAG: hypothetical protein BWK80_44820 [Desulfobacteraceae bacterium IS3]|nr:MAG: hypothetical protein BWK80_44820 [Desulfobacteraceae bacterium IS3]
MPGKINMLKYIKFFCFFLLLPLSSAGGDIPEIMIINSDSSVEKYKSVQEEFRQVCSYPISEINLEDKKQTIEDIEKSLIGTHPDLIYCIGTKAYLIANRYAGSRPVVFTSVINWLRLPRTPKTYGVSSELSAEMQIMLYRYIFPYLTKLGVLYGEKYNKEWVQQAGDEAKKIGVEIIGRPVSDSKETISALKALLPSVEAFWMISDPMVMGDKDILSEVLKTCDSLKKPVFSYHDVLSQYGVILTVSADIPTIGRQAAGIALEVLSGAEIKEKVQFPAGTDITLNLKKVKEYNLKYSDDALGSVNHLIE